VLRFDADGLRMSTPGRDRFSALISRALRARGMRFRFSPDEPSHDVLARSVQQMSAGRFPLAPLA
jgi:hypothetical protein